MKEILNRLHDYIIGLVVTLEEELDFLKKDKVSAIKAKKNITELLNKLVILITQLNKLKKEDEINNSQILMPEEDKQIIDRFLERYKKDL